MCLELGRLLETHLEEPDRAVNHLEKARTFSTGAGARALPALDRLYTRLDAPAELAQILEAQAEQAQVPADRLGLLFRLGQLAESRLSSPTLAVSAYERILELEPRHLPSLRLLEPLYEAAGDDQKLAGILEVQQELATGAERERVMVKRARVAAEGLEDAEGSIALYRELLEKNPRNEQAWLALETLLERTGQFEALRELVSQRLATAVDPRELVRLNERMGRVLATMLERPEEALPFFRAALERDPRNRPGAGVPARAVRAARAPRRPGHHAPPPHPAPGEPRGGQGPAPAPRRGPGGDVASRGVPGRGPAGHGDRAARRGRARAPGRPLRQPARAQRRRARPGADRRGVPRRGGAREGRGGLVLHRRAVEGAEQAGDGRLRPGARARGGPRAPWRLRGDLPPLPGGQRLALLRHPGRSLRQPAGDGRGEAGAAARAGAHPGGPAAPEGRGLPHLLPRTAAPARRRLGPRGRGAARRGDRLLRRAGRGLRGGRGVGAAWSARRADVLGAGARPGRAPRRSRGGRGRAAQHPGVRPHQPRGPRRAGPHLPAPRPVQGVRGRARAEDRGGRIARGAQGDPPRDRPGLGGAARRRGRGGDQPHPCAGAGAGAADAR